MDSRGAAGSRLGALLQRRGGVAVLDGGMGTGLASFGLTEQECWTAGESLADPRICEAVKGVYLAYLRAGADILTVNTYNVSAQKFLNRAAITLRDRPVALHEQGSSATGVLVESAEGALAKEAEHLSANFALAREVVALHAKVTCTGLVQNFGQLQSIQASNRNFQSNWKKGQLHANSGPTLRIFALRRRIHPLQCRCSPPRAPLISPIRADRFVCLECGGGLSNTARLCCLQTRELRDVDPLPRRDGQPRERGRGEPGRRAGQRMTGSDASWLPTTAQQLYTRFPNTFDTSISESAMRPDPRSAATVCRRPHWRPFTGRALPRRWRLGWT
jgi:hypothetical protein